MTDIKRGRRRRRAGRSLATFLCAMLIFYGLPLGFETGRAADIVGLVLFVVGFFGLSWLIVRQIRVSLVRSADAGGQVYGLLALVYIVVVFFALFYYILELNSPGQFNGLETRTDSLYFTVATLGTVGYGDVHAVGQIARIATTLQIIFDLVVIGLLLAVASSQITQNLGRSGAVRK